MASRRRGHLCPNGRLASRRRDHLCPNGRISAADWRTRLPVQTVAALHAEAVAAQVVVPAPRAHQAARWIRLKPSPVFPPRPHAVFRPHHPPPSSPPPPCPL